MTFDKVPAWAAWLAQDADGVWWAYEAEPNKQDNIARLGQSAPPPDWEATLIAWPPKA
ncbi:hypothetical protein [Thiobacillus sp. SCN 63-57]|uniref:hypothetical protein n=1 Tax=Thiobacillus sp. SCN 63-57 TaxID=1660145 RepID=UPI0025F98747|nr:hypothetical protein [Thiobacillus sp. SCN 63-57]